MSLAIIQLVLLCFTVLAAFRFGGWPEVYVSGFFLFGIILDRLAHSISIIETNLNFTVWHLILEVLLTASLFVVALRANRLWPIFVVSFQLVALVALILQASGLGTQPLAWAILSQTPTWLAIALTHFGILSRLRERKKQLEL